METAILGGGCFWCLEVALGELRGVVDVISGYAGGHDEYPTYEAVCSGETGHAEVVQVQFDPLEIDYSDLLAAFFTIHDPTTLNRQGNDVGSQYRSVIFYCSEQQKMKAEAFMKSLNTSGDWPNPLVTALRPAGIFYPAESCHRDYYRLHAEQPYCRIVVAPKVNKLREKFCNRLSGKHG
ncbi:MAG: peptide-methionine (S)-S-oxide reductase MsrA [Sulfuricellaceae bacterium]|nr:peptide-methionine (S)-S-oxide reductase MsrA [Sulfuricellaceae bacterium]